VATSRPKRSPLLPSCWKSCRARCWCSAARAHARPASSCKPSNSA